MDSHRHQVRLRNDCVHSYLVSLKDMTKTHDTEAEREALRRLRDEAFSQEPPPLADEKLQRRMCEVLVKALNDSQTRQS